MPGDSSKGIIYAAVQYHPLYPPKLDVERLPIYINPRRLSTLTNYLEATDKDLTAALKRRLIPVAGNAQPAHGSRHVDPATSCSAVQTLKKTLL
ncbi:hypothetical protein GL50803_009051 [Giardia duodenalis]|uniref:Uncharacterized protein n=1 Tax=Giardia intestinalis (strain ATCC 50803 / WB clone C6) TaxID=184922 RepID=A8BY00_GIAIC|nr:hypothetical protein GL50803_009051 [Giardia intestinalis]KAE8304818.1 hypothetical protein GL50803_009051 [Giardia intestinalis]|eukprot:XP_001704250.1 Hypothetical protein GL50803_9051 [Giardia lamblia ATCC 50803]